MREFMIVLLLSIFVVAVAEAEPCPKTNPPLAGLGIRSLKSGDYCLYQSQRVAREIPARYVAPSPRKGECKGDAVRAASWLPSKKGGGQWFLTGAAWCVDTRATKAMRIRFRKRARSSLE